MSLRNIAQVKLLKNERASEFMKEITPVHRPDMNIDSQFIEKYPDVSKKLKSWKTSTIQDDFIKCEYIIDFLRMNYIRLEK